MNNKVHLTLIATILVFFSAMAQQTKPNIWVYSDLTDPRDQREGGYPKGDQDDMASLASLLLSANRFYIQSIVLTSGPFSGTRNPLNIIEELFIPAYKEHIHNLKDDNHNYQEHIHFQWSSVTNSGGKPKRFKEYLDYKSLRDYETVQSLADFAKNNEVYVLVWGPLTEPAILVKHLINTGQKQALKNVTIISHWGKSYIRSMHKEALKTDPFAVTNSRMDKKASHYVHKQAELGNVKMIQLGCVGESGIVDGAVNYTRIEEFDNNPLGQIFISAKYIKNSPDQSDAATYWLLASDLGFSLNDYPHNGELSKDIEIKNVTKFHNAAPAIMDNLLLRSNLSEGKPYRPSFIAKYLCYSYYRWGRYCIYAPNPVDFRILTAEGKVEKEGTLKRWNNTFNLPKKEQGYYRAELLFEDETIVKAL